jgi:hypothetical protein
VTLRILKAFAWLRWRMLVNSLERTGSRDALERFSLAIEKLGPIMAAVLLVPSALFLTGLGLAAGYSLAADGPTLPFTLARYLLFAVPALAIAGPLFLPAADRTNPVRLLLLPIPRATLYLAQTATALGDPWNLLLLALLAGMPVGLAVGGALAPALVCLVAAALLVVLIAGLSALATSLLHLVARDRRRGELVALVFIVLIPVVAMLPALLDGQSRRTRSTARAPLLPAWANDAGRRALAAYPTELFVNATRAARAGDTRATATALGGLSLFALVVHGTGLFAFRRVLDSPGGSAARRSVPMRPAWTMRLPGLSSGASAVALAQLRLALRTPRGRSILLSPLAMFAIFGVMMYRGGSSELDFGPFNFTTGLGLATFSAFVCLLSILPLAMNQFAVDRAGLTMALLSPLGEGEFLAGKAAGNALVTAMPIIVCLTAGYLLFPGGPGALWLSLPIGLLAVYLLVAPVAAISSALFPRAVDMNSIGRGSNAHGAAGFIGLLAFLVAGAPPMVLALVATRLLERPWLAPVLVGSWCLVACGIAWLLFIPARRVFASRRENLAMIR